MEPGPCIRCWDQLAWQSVFTSRWWRLSNPANRISYFSGQYMLISLVRQGFITGDQQNCNIPICPYILDMTCKKRQGFFPFSSLFILFLNFNACSFIHKKHFFPEFKCDSQSSSVSSRHFCSVTDWPRNLLWAGQTVYVIHKWVKYRVNPVHKAHNVYATSVRGIMGNRT